MQVVRLDHTSKSGTEALLQPILDLLEFEGVPPIPSVVTVAPAPIVMSTLSVVGRTKGMGCTGATSMTTSSVVRFGAEREGHNRQQGGSARRRALPARASTSAPLTKHWLKTMGRWRISARALGQWEARSAQSGAGGAACPVRPLARVVLLLLSDYFAVRSGCRAVRSYSRPGQFVGDGGSVEHVVAETGIEEKPIRPSRHIGSIRARWVQLAEEAGEDHRGGFIVGT